MSLQVFPAINEFKRLAKTCNLIPVYCEILADTETPVSAYLSLTNNDKCGYSYLLESVEQGGKLGRYSFICVDAVPLNVKDNNKSKATPVMAVNTLLHQYKPADIKGLPRFWGGTVGVVSYEYVRRLEKLSNPRKDANDFPEMLFMRGQTVVLFDHVERKMKIVYAADLTKNNNNPVQAYEAALRNINLTVDSIKAGRAAKNKVSINKKQKNSSSGKQDKWVHSLPQKQFTAMVRKNREYIRSGDIIQMVLSQRIHKKLECQPFSIYRVLRTINPSPYMFYLKFKDLYVIGTSPEILVRKEGAVAEVRPIAGTRPRGKTEADDLKNEQNLLRSIKERAEHLMLVDLGRNDLGRVCRYGTVKVPEFMVVERYSHVMHIVSSVTGKLNTNVTAGKLFDACFPAGTVTGAPKVRAMQIIDELEPVTRGIYAGAVGYFSYQGNMDMAIAIRTIVVKDGRVYIQAGAGIVADSVPEKEFKETEAKAAALVRAVKIAEEGVE
ncbi:MAG: anthranilate synthase component I [Elusimicrobiota bacterium]